MEHSFKLNKSTLDIELREMLENARQRISARRETREFVFEKVPSSSSILEQSSEKNLNTANDSNICNSNHFEKSNSIPVYDEEEFEKDESPSEINDYIKWSIDNVCISDLCYELKDSTRITALAQMSDIQKLVLNDIYIFDKNSEFSVSTYFTDYVHQLIKETLISLCDTPVRGRDCYDWCLQLESRPPVDLRSSLSLCAQWMKAACNSGNVLDMHTANVLTQILPALCNDTVGDPRYYLSSLLHSVFISDPLLRIKWANSQLTRDENNEIFTPDFSVYNLTGSTRCVVLIAELKQGKHKSYAVSDLVTLATQMKYNLNKLIEEGVKEPKVCGIHCEGDNIYTFIMDNPSPELYRLSNVKKLKLFDNLDQISLLPSILSHFLYLKAIACETAEKVETAVLYKYNNLKRSSPKESLSSKTGVKKQKINK